MQRDKQTGLVLPISIASERNKAHDATQIRAAKKNYTYFCKKCGHQESFKTKGELRDFKHTHKRKGCPMMLLKDEKTGITKMVRQQIYDKRMAEVAEMRKNMLEIIRQQQLVLDTRAIKEAAKIKAKL